MHLLFHKIVTTYDDFVVTTISKIWNHSLGDDECMHLILTKILQFVKYSILVYSTIILDYVSSLILSSLFRN